MVASLLLSQDSLLPAMQTTPRSPLVRSIYGGSLVPVLIVVAALALSTAIFFLFTQKKMQAQKEAAKVEAATNSAPSKTAAAPAKPAA